MKANCRHPNCHYYYNLNSNGFCEYHQAELDNNGKPGHVTCSWCTEWNQMNEDMLRSRFDI